MYVCAVALTAHITAENSKRFECNVFLSVISFATRSTQTHSCPFVRFVAITLSRKHFRMNALANRRQHHRTHTPHTFVCKFVSPTSSSSGCVCLFSFGFGTDNANNRFRSYVLIQNYRTLCCYAISTEQLWPLCCRFATIPMHGRMNFDGARRSQNSSEEDTQSMSNLIWLLRECTENYVSRVCVCVRKTLWDVSELLTKIRKI